MMWVKICGNTNLEDAARAAELGSDAVGFIFAASKRQVTAAQVAAITAHLPPGLERVGVFDSHNAEEIAETALRAGLTAVQLHDGLDERLIADLVKALADRFAGRVQIIQTLHWVVGDESSSRRMEEEIRRLAPLVAQGLVDRVLVDSKVGAAGGGTGVAFDWTLARNALARLPGSTPLIVAGGLRPGNVAEAISQLAPWGVDVCSGVETSPGRKDSALLAAFLASAHGAETP
jgi:phosphoribosylanthranilate isomerase